MNRRPLTSLRRLKLFEAHGGVCHICEIRIHGERGEKWDVEHVIPIAMGGKDDESNMRPAHVDCHAGKSKVDARNLAKVNRQRAKHFGAWKPSGFRKMPEGYKWDWRLQRAVKEAR